MNLKKRKGRLGGALCKITHDSYLRFLDGVCARALPAAVFEALLVVPLRKTLDAALAARGDVTFCELLFAIMFTSVHMFRWDYTIYVQNSQTKHNM